MISKILVVVLAGAIAILIACAPAHSERFKNTYAEANQLLHATTTGAGQPFLKAHLKNGDVCIFKDHWKVDTISNVLNGVGQQYNFQRSMVKSGDIKIPFDSVVIYETNTKLKTGAAPAALGLLIGAEAILGFICITNPKACFGSCPTFYMNENESFHFANAEGFSNAILPSMEYGDIDALRNEPLSNAEFSLTMKNEALETHCVNEVKLLAYPRLPGDHIYQSNQDEFFRCDQLYPADHATATEGNITTQVRRADHVERFSLADSSNLSHKEEIYLTFNNLPTDNRFGLVMDFRQTLMTTYFIYSAIGYMGDEASDILAQVETKAEWRKRLGGGLKRELGKIDIYTWSEEHKKWIFQGDFYETGPIALNSQVLPFTLKQNQSTLRVKIVLNSGLWRIDYIALAHIAEKIMPLTILPSRVDKNGITNQTSLTEILDPEQHLISMPGDEFKFTFCLPDATSDYELFLYSKGYYLEWLRQHWLKDKDLPKLRQMVVQPGKYLKEEAGSYKQYETQMEEDFWNSRIDTKTISYHEM